MQREVLNQVMKKIKSPWYGVVWILIWTAALIWFLVSGMFTTRESVGLVVVWLIMVGITAYLLVKHLRSPARRRAARQEITPSEPARNAPCPCGSGKKYKRCCATE